MSRSSAAILIASGRRDTPSSDQRVKRRNNSGSWRNDRASPHPIILDPAPPRTAFLTNHRTIGAERHFLLNARLNAHFRSACCRVFLSFARCSELGVSLLPNAITIDDLLLARHALCMSFSSHAFVMSCYCRRRRRRRRQHVILVVGVNLMDAIVVGHHKLHKIAS